MPIIDTANIEPRYSQDYIAVIREVICTLPHWYNTVLLRRYIKEKKISYSLMEGSDKFNSPYLQLKECI